MAHPIARLGGYQVLFDWNGTVVDDLARAHASTNDVLADVRLPPLDLAKFRLRFTLPLETLFLDLGVPADQAPAAGRRWSEYMSARATTLRPGARELLEWLRASGARIGILSAAGDATVRADMRQLDVEAGWQDLITDCHNKAAALGALRSRSPDAVFVGDTAYDIRSARAAGFQAIGIAGGYGPTDQLVAAGADHIVDQLDELVGLLTQQGVPA